MVHLKYCFAGETIKFSLRESLTTVAIMGAAMMNSLNRADKTMADYSVNIHFHTTIPVPTCSMVLY